MRGTKWNIRCGQGRRAMTGGARAFTALLLGAGATAVTGHAAADGATTPSVVLNTMVLAARAPRNDLPIGKMRGTGSMDPVITQISPTQLLVADTASVPYNGDSGVQGMLTLVELTKEGPKVVGQFLMPREQGERVHMKMNLVPLDFHGGNQLGARSPGAIAEARVLLTYATEDNQGDNGNGDNGPGSEGANNGNPQTVAWVVKVKTAAATTFATAPLTTQAGTTLPTGTLTLLRKVNTVSLTGDQDGQQYGAEGVTCVDDVCNLALQRNNATTSVSRFKINADGTMARVIPRRTNNQNGQHSRPVFAMDFKGRLFEAIVDTNDQPAKNVRVWELNANTQQTVKSAQIMKGIDAQKLYVSRPYAGAVKDLGDSLNPAAKTALTAKSPIFTFAGVAQAVRIRNQVGGDNQNGHGGSGTETLLMALDPDTMVPIDGAATPVLSALPRTEGPGAVKVNSANFGRHASMIVASAYGPTGKALPAAVLLSASSTGTAAGYAQFMPYDAAAGKFDVRANKNRFSLGFADIANQTKGKRNPNNQAGAFLNGVTDIPNPFYGDASSKQPEVASYAAIPVSGAFDISGTTPDRSMGLRITFIPQTWTEKVSVQPGPAKPVEEVPTGPTPTIQSNLPGAGTPGGDDGAPIDSPTDDSTGGGAAGRGRMQPETASCAAGARGAAGGSGVALLGVGLAVLALGRRRTRGGQKEGR